jgi:acyl carrier protein
MSNPSIGEIHRVVIEAVQESLHALGTKTHFDLDGNFGLFTSGNLDSLGFVKLLMSIEQKLGQKLDLQAIDFNNVETLDALVIQINRVMHK